MSETTPVLHKDDEIIVAVPTKEMFPRYSPQGFMRTQPFPALVEKRRGDLETDPTYKQLISYVICRDSRDRILAYTRLEGGGEDRLHGLTSIGIGGHMNPIPAVTPELLCSLNAYRELEEEINAKPLVLTPIGFLNDDSNSVGQVHLGIVYTALVDPDEVHITETDTLKVEWVSPRQLKDMNLEPWSQILLDQYLRKGV